VFGREKPVKVGRVDLALERRLGFVIALLPFSSPLFSSTNALKRSAAWSYCPAIWSMYRFALSKRLRFRSQTRSLAMPPFALVSGRAFAPRNLADEEIPEIKRTGGVVGVILMTYWLDPANPGPGLPPICRTIAYLVRRRCPVTVSVFRALRASYCRLSTEITT